MDAIRRCVLICALVVASPCAMAQDLIAQDLRTQQIDIQYVEPKTGNLRPVYELVMQARVLENIRDLLAPLRLPRRLLIKTESCDGESNAWYENDAVTVCYEFLDEFWKNVPDATTRAG